MLCVLLLLLVVSTGAGAGASHVWSIDSSDDDLTATLNSVKVLSHSAKLPCVYIGAGSTQFAEHHGNFDITDNVERRIPLSEVTKSGGKNKKYSFSAKTDSALKIELEFLEEEPLAGIAFSDLPSGYDRIWVRFFAEKDEYVVGGGEQFTTLNMRGRKYPIWTREQGVGRNKSSLITFYADTLAGGAGGDYHTTYYGEPTFFSSRGIMIHSQASYYSVLDFTSDIHHELEVHGNIGKVKVAAGVGTSISELSQIYTKEMGVMPELPDWVLGGSVVGLQGGTKRMNDLLNTIESNGVSVSAVWIQDWSGRIRTSFGRRVFWNWEWDPTHYPNLDTEIPKLKARGVRILTYINPYLNVEGPLFKEANAHGYFVKNGTDQTYIADFGEFFCGTIDLTNPMAVKWFKARIVKRAMDLGISGWMADFSEYLMVDNAKFYSNQTAKELHNLWPLLWGKLNREAVEEASKLGDVVFWMRAGFAGISNYTTLFWAGDQNVDYSLSDGMPSTVPAALSIGLQGVGMTHFDIGCFTSLYNITRSKELFLRSAESAVFTPMMRTHEGNRPSENWQLYSDVDTMNQFGRLVKMFKELSSYAKDAIKNYTLTGIPVQRALSSEFPQDMHSREIEHQYMYGDDLLVAMVTKPNVTEWTCYIPPGQWVHLWSGESYSQKGEVTVAAPIGQPPVFYRKSSTYDFEKLKLPLVPVPTANPGSGNTGNYLLFPYLTLSTTLLISYALAKF